MDKNIHYSVMSVSKRFNERCVGGFETRNDREAKKKFKRWWPKGNGYLRYKLYRLIDTAAGK